MRRTAARALLALMQQRYDYDTSYMRHMLETAPAAFFKFIRIVDVSRHREAAPQAAIFAAKLVGALVEDCGPCTQLVVNMAREARVPAADIAAVLRRDTSAMSAEAALGFRFAEAIAYRLPHEDDARDAVRAAWGEKGLIDLSLALTIARVWPQLKAGLGYAKACRRVTVDGAGVDVVKRAA